MTDAKLRQEHKLIAEWVDSNSVVLDLGCDEGILLAHLAETKQVTGYGIEIDINNVVAAMGRGVSVIQADLEAGLAGFDDKSVDTVIIGQTLQSLRNTEKLVDEIMRVGKRAIVSFPNFGYWRVRSYLYFRGRMPVSKRLPYEWYNTPNLHLFTIKDFEQLCRDKDITICDQRYQTGQHMNSMLTRMSPNVFAELAVFCIQPKASSS
jgi:methionine biosynthesis protein MetW